jgi:hypothetical protein
MSIYKPTFNKESKVYMVGLLHAVKLCKIMVSNSSQLKNILQIQNIISKPRGGKTKNQQFNEEKTGVELNHQDHMNMNFEREKRF